MLSLRSRRRRNSRHEPAPVVRIVEKENTVRAYGLDDPFPIAFMGLAGREEPSDEAAPGIP